MQTLLQKVQDIFASEQFMHEPQELYAPIDYTLRLGGKRIRPMLLLAANQMFHGDMEQVRHAAVGIETFHNFTLLHDDLMDKSPIRRGQPTVYRKWDENTAILSGDTMFALAWRYFLVQPHARLQEILNCFNETAILVCEGQQYDMNFERRDNITLPDYMMMIRLKTAVLLAGALKIGALYADAPQQDIRDNKKTYLILSALQTAPEPLRNELHDLFSSLPENSDEKVARVLQIYHQLGIRQQVETAIDDEFAQAKQHLDAVQADEALKRPLRELTATLSGRKK